MKGIVSMNALLVTLYVAGLAAPIIAFVRGTRRPDATNGSLIVAATVAGAVFGLAYVALLGFPSTDWVAHAPWAIAFASWGAFIGIAGVLARLAGRLWNARI
jgi:hypothetical protein